MGKLVHFDRRGRQLTSRPAARGTAQILIFTGVRYERDGTPIPVKPISSMRTKRKRV